MVLFHVIVSLLSLSRRFPAFFVVEAGIIGLAPRLAWSCRPRSLGGSLIMQFVCPLSRTFGKTFRERIKRAGGSPRDYVRILIQLIFLTSLRPLPLRRATASCSSPVMMIFMSIRHNPGLRLLELCIDRYVMRQG